ncbi:MAG: relaxase domain-containing protein [Acidimicrobiales bacterium]|nr:relaxase domain-containing protein [Acidimicrobiales bacterium]
MTVLGARSSDRGSAAGAVVAYLSGDGANRLAANGSLGEGKPLLGQESGPGAYYSDSGARPGRWRGAAVEQLGATVDPDQLRRALLGQNPATGEQLVGAHGSSGRTTSRRTLLPDGPAGELFTLDQAAAHIGVDVSYLRRLAAKTATSRSTEAPSPGSPTSTNASPGAYLDAVKVRGQWRVTRAEIDRFVDSRRQPQVVIGYDITFSAPKSLSILWATGSPEVRALCEEAFDAGVAAGVDYLERHAIWVRRGRGYEPAGGMFAASYRHDTNRELEPQLHEHVVIANMASAADGRTQALDARGLFAHATTAGHLAEAEMQHHTNRRGLAWTPTHRGIANVAGVSDDAIQTMSTRREQILSLTSELGTNSTHARQTAALATRAAKDHGVDPTDLRYRWTDRLAEVGFGPAELAAATTAAPARLWTPDDTRRLDAHLAGPHGVTEMVAIFDRRDVICAIVDRTGGRLSAAEVIAHADRWLHTDAVIPLATTSHQRQEVIGHEGKIGLAADATYYTTPTMVALEQAISHAWAIGLDTGAAVVPDEVISRAIADWEHATGLRLGDDQIVMVRAICGSGDRFQAVVGPAGTGKTAALEVAARAWEAAGYRVIGTAVNGTAAEVLARSTGIDARTVASLVTRLDTATTPVIDNRTVVVVDEASTLGNRHHARLTHHITQAGAAMRAVGDPAQHSAVEAGGMWAELVRRYPDRTPALVENRRQASAEMVDVRLAAADYRNGRIAEALARLDTNQRIVTAPTAPELLDQLAADWYVDRRHAGRPSRMIAEHHHDRRALNARAQALLSADGSIDPDGVRIGEATFHVGDEVIARAQNRHLRPPGAGRDAYVRNGNTGTVTAITGPAGHQGLIVDFADRGPIRVPHDWLTAEVRPGVVGGIAPAYAVTSHAAQGDTYRAGRMLATDTSQREAVYVGLTRGTDDTRIYTVKREPAGIDTDPQLPRIDDPRTALEALSEQLAKPRPADLATIADDDVAQVVAHLNRPLRDLEADQSPLAQRAAAVLAERIGHRAVTAPTSLTLDEIGQRSTHPSPADWDLAATRVALYRERWDIVDESTLLPTPYVHAPTAQRAEQRSTHDAVITANAARLINEPTRALAAERIALLASLEGSPLPDAGILQARLQRADERLSSATAIERTARTAHEHACSPRARRRDPDGPERSRRALADAAEAVQRASNDARHASAVLRAQPDDVAARRSIVERVETIDRALDPRIERACALPAEYLTTELGPRNDGNAPRWDAAAEAIETYRHRHLGLEPVDGPLPLREALGEQTVDPMAARAWLDAHPATGRADDAVHQRPLRISR